MLTTAGDGSRCVGETECSVCITEKTVGDGYDASGCSVSEMGDDVGATEGDKRET